MDRADIRLDGYRLHNWSSMVGSYRANLGAERSGAEWSGVERSGAEWSGGAVERWSGGAVERWSGGAVEEEVKGQG